jgi:hypothetical protein
MRLEVFATMKIHIAVLCVMTPRGDAVGCPLLTKVMLPPFLGLP